MLGNLDSSSNPGTIGRRHENVAGCASDVEQVGWSRGSRWVDAVHSVQASSGRRQMHLGIPVVVHISAELPRGEVRLVKEDPGWIRRIEQPTRSAFSSGDIGVPVYGVQGPGVHTAAGGTRGHALGLSRFRVCPRKRSHVVGDLDDNCPPLGLMQIPTVSLPCHRGDALAHAGDDEESRRQRRFRLGLPHLCHIQPQVEHPSEGDRLRIPASAARRRRSSPWPVTKAGESRT